MLSLLREILPEGSVTEVIVAVDILDVLKSVGFEVCEGCCDCRGRWDG